MSRRHHRGSPPPSGGGGRRPPPPPATGEEAAYLERRKNASDRVVVHLSDGSTVEGRITYFDRDVIKIECDRPPHRLLRKRDIRYIAES